MTPDKRNAINQRSWSRLKPQIPRAPVTRFRLGNSKRCTAQFAGINTQQEVMHNRICCKGQIDNMSTRKVRAFNQFPEHIIKTLPNDKCHSFNSINAGHSMRNTTNRISPESDLRVDYALGAENLRCLQID